MHSEMETPRLAIPASRAAWVEHLTGANARLKAFRPGLSFKLLSLIIGVSLISVLASSFLLLRFQRQQLVDAAQSSTTALSNTIEANLQHAMVTNDWVMLKDLVQAVAAAGDVETVRVLNTQGLVAVSSVAGEAGLWLEHTEPACRTCHAAGDGAGGGPSSNRTALFVSDAGRQSLLNVNVIHNQPECATCHGSEHETLGLLMVEAPLTQLQAQLTSSVRRIVLLGVGTLLLLIGAIVPVLRRSVLKPIDELSRGVTEIGSGNLDYRVPVTGPDELAILADRFDAMRRELKASHADMQRRNQELALLNEIALASSQMLEVQEVLDFALDMVVNRLRMRAGAIYLLDQDGEHTSRRACACAFNPGCQGAEALSTGCSCPHAFRCQALGDGNHRSTASPSATSHHANDRLFVANLEVSQRVDIWCDERSGRSYVNIPLRSKGRIVGTMALITHARQPLTRRAVDVLKAVGHEIGIAINNAQLYRQVRHLAVLEERDRLAREMHDSLAQALGYLNLQASLTQEQIARGRMDEAEASLVEFKELAKATYTDVREAIFSLRTTKFTKTGLVPVLEEYLAEYRAHYGVDARLQVDGDASSQFAPEVALQLLRVIQEALSNVRKHAQARQAWVRFEQQADAVTVTIEDDGRGFDLAGTGSGGRQHFGLDIMRERAEVAGGCLNVYSQPDQGTRVVVHVPRGPDTRA